MVLTNLESRSNLFDISSESSGPILTQLGMHDPYDKGFPNLYKLGWLVP